MTVETYLIFLVTTMVVVFSPGAAAVAIAAQGATNGGRLALFGVSGVAAANVVYFVLSATGIASLVIASNLLFSLIKWVGVAYLVYLGATAIFSKAGAINIRPDRKKSSARVLFVKGFIIEFANPKALLYFAAILPQFLNTSLPILPQIALMGITTVFIDVFSYSAYAFLGDRIARGGVKDWVVSLINKTAGGALLFAGFKMAGVSAAK